MSKQQSISKRVRNLENVTVSIIGITVILTVLAGITLGSITNKKDEN